MLTPDSTKRYLPWTTESSGDFGVNSWANLRSLLASRGFHLGAAQGADSAGVVAFTLLFRRRNTWVDGNLQGAAPNSEEHECILQSHSRERANHFPRQFL